MTIESEALGMGWIPKEQFKGDPTKWTDAETYVERGKNLLPIVRKHNENLSRTVEGQAREIGEMKQSLAAANEAMEAFREFHNDVSKREYDRAKAELLGDKKQARTDGDVDREVEIDAELATLNSKAPKELKAPEKKEPTRTPEADPTYVAWQTENSDWLGKDKAKTAFATSAAAYVRAMEPTLQGRAFLDRVKEEVMAKFPEEGEGGEGEDPPPAPRAKVAPAGRNGSARSGAHTYANLPPEAKAACDRFAGRLAGEGKAFKDVEAYRKDYVTHYDWS